MRNIVNWLLIIGGGLLMIVEMLLGAATGFDLMLIGGCLAAGGGAGLILGSTQVGLFTSGALALVYFLLFRRWLRARLTAKEQPSNVDAVIGHTGVVTVRVTALAAGQVKVADETWRAVLAPGAPGAREPGETVTVESVSGVTLTVR